MVMMKKTINHVIDNMVAGDAKFIKRLPLELNISRCQNGTKLCL
jgi:hypothetical protein